MLKCYYCRETCQSTKEEWYTVDLGINTVIDVPVCAGCLDEAYRGLYHNYRLRSTKVLAWMNDETIGSWLENSIIRYEVEFDDLDVDCDEYQNQIEEWEAENRGLVYSYEGE